MLKFACLFTATVLFLNSGNAQTLFTYGKDEVSKQEFLRNYEKNTLNKKPDMSEAALREYVDLYSLFKMKVKEAEIHQIDTMPAIQRELDNYRRQLSKNYLTDKQVNEALVKEAYDRSKEERRVAHILLTAPANMSPIDTLRLYQRADSIYDAITKKKADFATLARMYSDDKGSKENGGDIGFMTAMQTIYAFENAAYNTDVNKVSKPFRTPLGYHIVKVLEKRPARGEVQVAQILFATPKSKGEEGIAAAKSKADLVYAELKKGTSFEEMVKKYSEDKFTVNEGGMMQQFGAGTMVPAFENAAFALKNPGDISQPVQTDYGFHILKLINKYPIKPFDSVSNQLKRKVENDSRSEIAKNAFFEKIKQKNKFKEYPANFDELKGRIKALPDTGKIAGVFTAQDFSNMNKPLFSLDNNNYTQSDMMKFVELMTRGRIMGNRENVAQDLYRMYVDKVVNDYQEHKLIDENPEFRNLMTEYRDGIMLFELMDRNIWTKASKDTVGLKAFYEANKSKYQWEPGFEGNVYRFKDETSMKQGQKLLLANKNMTNDEFVKAMNTESALDAVMIQTGRYEFSKFTDVSREELVKGSVSRPVKNDDGSYTIVKTNEVYSTTAQKSLDDARGYVVAEYQDYLEKQWNATLRDHYKMKLDEKVFKSMVK